MLKKLKNIDKNTFIVYGNKNAFLLFSGLLLLLLANFLIYLVLLLAIASVIYSVNNVIYALSISFFVFLLNPVLYQFPEATVTVLRLALLIFSFIRVVALDINRVLLIRPIGFLIMTSLVILALIIAVSPYKILSFTKLIQFLLAAVTGIVAFQKSNRDSNYWFGFFFSFYLVIILGSLVSFFLPGVAYAVNNLGFQGVTNHPQTFGVFIAPFIVMTFYKIKDGGKTSYLMIFLFIVCLTLSFLSLSRTSFFAALLGIVSVPLVNIGTATLSKTKVIVSAMFVGLAVGIVMVSGFGGAILANFNNFISKWEKNSDIEEVYSKSRGGLVETQMENFRNHPITGIGFQMPSGNAEDLSITYDPIFNLPIGASIEKGNIYTSILEELGLIGAVLFTIFFGQIILKVRKNRTGYTMALVLTIFFTNFSEASLFSSGGIGLFLWLLIGFSLKTDKIVDGDHVEPAIQTKPINRLMRV